MLRFFDVKGWAGLPAYLMAVTALYALPPLYVEIAASLAGVPLREPNALWLFPFRALTQSAGASSWLVVGGLLATLASAAGIAALSLRRTGGHHATGWTAALSMVPILQFPAVALVAFPLHEDDAPARTKEISGRVRGDDVAKGVIAGVGLMVFAVAVATLGFGTYGFGLFMLTPLLVGLSTGYIANRQATISPAHTAGGVFGASAVGSAMLLFYGLEGGICMIMAIPITGVLAIFGGAVGREMAIATRRRIRPTVMSLAVLPFAFALEASAPSQLALATSESIDVAAPPAAVWRAVIDMGEIEGKLALPFRLGLAHPLRSEIVGQGVGAERVGVFSTGVARERVTAWEPSRRLAFQVLSSPPAMRELSPYGQVQAPHVEGYFRTARTVFEIDPLDGERSRLTVYAEHTLRLQPAFYWDPLARWAIRSNSRRVLAHIARRAEAVANAPPPAQSEPRSAARLDRPRDPA